MTGLKSSLISRLLIILAALVVIAGVATGARAIASRKWEAPAENPPHQTAPEAAVAAPADAPSAPGAPTTEWTFHKSLDGSHPDGQEQQNVWLMNRARSDPPAEGVWLATTNDPDVAGGRDFFGVDKTMLQNEFASYSAKPPAAFDIRMYNGAKNHSDYLISVDGVGDPHADQFQRVADAGFTCSGARGNVFLWADNGKNAYAAWNIDWGGPEGGMQVGRGHRKAIMSLDGDYTNVGIALVADNDTNNNVGPVVATGNYCQANTSQPDHYNRFLVGTVWEDLDGDGIYDPGEGKGGVTVTPEQGTYYAVTGASGGFAIPLTSEGTYNVTYTGSGVNETKSITVGATSVLQDALVSGTGPSATDTPTPTTTATATATATETVGPPGTKDKMVYLPLVVKGSGSTPQPTATNTLSVPGPTDTATPTATTGPGPTDTPTPTATTDPGSSAWLTRFNYLRSLSGLAALPQDAALNDGCWKHSRYIVKNDILEHKEELGNPWYTAEGHQAALESNLMASSTTATTDVSAIDGWMTAPFHGIGMIDPRLEKTGFGSYREAVGSYQMGGCLNVLNGLNFGAAPAYPIMWPTDSQTMPFTLFDGSEWPDPLTSCPGYTAPVGPPIYLQLGSGSATVNVTGTSFKIGATDLDHCVFDENTYANPVSDEQDLARSILGGRNAVVIFPKAPLTDGATYMVSVTNDGTTYAWSFTVNASALAPTLAGNVWIR